MSNAATQDQEAEDGTSVEGWVKGLWTAASKSYVCTIAMDGSLATVQMSTPAVKGHFRLKSLSPPVYPGGETQDELAGSEQDGKVASTELLPNIHLVQVIPTGIFEADLDFQGRPLRFKGMGGHMHIWAAGSWFDTTLGWRVCRGVAGPVRRFQCRLVPSHASVSRDS